MTGDTQRLVEYRLAQAGEPVCDYREFVEPDQRQAEQFLSEAQRTWGQMRGGDVGQA